MRNTPYVRVALVAFALVAGPSIAQNQTGSAAQARPGGVQAQTGSRELGRPGVTPGQTGSAEQARPQQVPRQPVQPQPNDQPSPGAAIPPSTNPGVTTGNGGRAATPAPQIPGVNVPRTNQPGAASPNVPNVTAPGQPAPGTVGSPSAQIPVQAPTSGAPAGSPPFFTGADINQDGMLSVDEMRTFIPFFNDEQFNQFDTNADGVLTPAEAAGPIAGRPVMQSTLDAFSRGDTNTDQRLTPDELRRIAPQFTRENYRQWDQDQDGFITSDEWTAASRGSVVAGMQDLSVMNADTDADGFVSARELGVLMPNVTNEEFGRVDTNQDGNLSSDELSASGGANSTIVRGNVESYNRVDSNNDGSVTFSELAASAPQFRQEQFTEMDTNRDGILGIDEWSLAVPGAAPNSVLSDGRLARADTNNNGRISFREMSRVAPNVTRTEFGAADTNQDGSLSRAELQAAGGGASDQSVTNTGYWAPAAKHGEQ